MARIAARRILLLLTIAMVALAIGGACGTLDDDADLVPRANGSPPVLPGGTPLRARVPVTIVGTSFDPAFDGNEALVRVVHDGLPVFCSRSGRIHGGNFAVLGLVPSGLTFTAEVVVNTNADLTYQAGGDHTWSTPLGRVTTAATFVIDGRMPESPVGWSDGLGCPGNPTL